MAKHIVTPEELGYHVGSVPMALKAGTTNELGLPPKQAPPPSSSRPQQALCAKR